MPLDIEQQKIYLEIWAKAVDTQMHFNEMSVKSRQLGLTFVAAALGVALVLISKGQDFSIPITICSWSFKLHVAVLLIIGAATAIYLVRILDLNVYHRMLRGAVTFGEDFEEVYIKPNIYNLDKGMTQAISHFSRHDNASTTMLGNKKQYLGDNEKSAEKKIKKFYNSTFVGLTIVAIIMFWATH